MWRYCFQVYSFDISWWKPCYKTDHLWEYVVKVLSVFSQEKNTLAIASLPRTASGSSAVKTLEVSTVCHEFEIWWKGLGFWNIFSASPFILTFRKIRSILVHFIYTYLIKADFTNLNLFRILPTPLVVNHSRQLHYRWCEGILTKSVCHIEESSRSDQS